MRLSINNNPEVLEGDRLSITELLEVKKYSFRMLVVKVNEKIVKKEDYASTFVTDGDQVLVLHLMSGG